MFLSVTLVFLSHTRVPQSHSCSSQSHSCSSVTLVFLSHTRVPQSHSCSSITLVFLKRAFQAPRCPPRPPFPFLSDNPSAPLSQQCVL
eukprot:2234202-Rhodomonas_salina.1